MEKKKSKIMKILLSLIKSLFKVVLISFIIAGCEQSRTVPHKLQRIVVEVEISKYFHWQIQEIFTFKDEINIHYSQFDTSVVEPEWKTNTEKVTDGKAKWIIYSNDPVMMLPPLGMVVLMKPGDSIHIKYPRWEDPVYSGNNAKLFELINALMKLNNQLVKPPKKHIQQVIGLQDYMQWNKYSEDLLKLKIPLIDTYKDSLAPGLIEYYRAHTINAVENERVAAFKALRDSVQYGYPELSFSDLNAIWDSTQCNKWRQWLNSRPNSYCSVNDLYSHNRLEAWRRFNFDTKNDSLISKEARSFQHYNNAKKFYQGNTRERLLAYIVGKDAIESLGIHNSVSQIILKDYYSQPGFTSFKKLVKQLETNAKL